MVVIFWFTSPFILDQPLQQKGLGVKEGIGVGIVVGIKNVERGSLTKRLVFFLFLGSCLILLARTENRFQVNGVLGWIIIFYLSWMLLSVMWSNSPLYTLRRVVLTDILWCAALITVARSSLRELAIIAVFVTGVTLLIAIGNELRLGTMEPQVQTWRFSGVMHSIPMGWNCGLLAMSSIFLVTGEKRRGPRNFLIISIIIALVFMAMTRSRGPAAAAIVGMGYYYYHVLEAKRKVFVILCVVISLSAGYVAIGDTMLYYGEAATTMGRGAESSKQVANLTGRVPLWKYALTYAAERPFHGYGYCSFFNVKILEDINSKLKWVPNSLHSGYINELMGTGFVGMGCLIAILILALIRAFRLSKRVPAYHYVVAVLLWLIINLAVEAGLIIGGTFMTFFCMASVTMLAFLPAEECG